MNGVVTCYGGVNPDGLTRLIIVSLKMIGGSNVAGVEHWNSHSLTKKGQSGTKTGKMAFNQAKEGGELRRKKSLKKTWGLHKKGDTRSSEEREDFRTNHSSSSLHPKRLRPLLLHCNCIFILPSAALLPKRERNIGPHNSQGYLGQMVGYHILEKDIGLLIINIIDHCFPKRFPKLHKLDWISTSSILCTILEILEFEPNCIFELAKKAQNNCL